MPTRLLKYTLTLLSLLVADTCMAKPWILDSTYWTNGEQCYLARTLYINRSPYIQIQALDSGLTTGYPFYIYVRANEGKVEKWVDKIDSTRSANGTNITAHIHDKVEFCPADEDSTSYLMRIYGLNGLQDQLVQYHGNFNAFLRADLQELIAGDYVDMQNILNQYPLVENINELATDISYTDSTSKVGYISRTGFIQMPGDTTPVYYYIEDENGLASHVISLADGSHYYWEKTEKGLQLYATKLVGGHWEKDKLITWWKLVGSGYCICTPGFYPVGSKQILTRGQLARYATADLDLMLHEIEARHGYYFIDEKWNEYFNQFNWYQQERKHPATPLTLTEKYNVELLKAILKEQH